MFENLGMDNDIQQEKDVLGGSRTLETAIYDFEIKMAYVTVSKGGAKAVNLTLETATKQTLRSTIYITNKEGKNFYVDKQNQKNYLPGFSLINNLAALTAEKFLQNITPEDKVIPIYDFDQKKELPTKVPVLVELLGKRVSAAVFKEVVDKTAKQTDGSYAPTGETREQNEIDKFFHIDSGLTVAELTAKATEAKFKQLWADKNTGVTREKAKGAKAGTPGAVAAGKPASATPAKSLFED